MAETWYPKAKRLPISTREYYKNRGMPILAVCDHITAGNDSRGWLQHADNQSSVHFLIRVEAGKGVVYQFIPIEWGAWGNGRHSGTGNPNMPQWVKDYIRQGINPNLFTISIEHEGVAPTAALYTGPMLAASIELHKWIAATVPTIKVDRAHVIGHYQIDHISRPFCPGGTNGRFFPFDAIIAAMKGTPTPPPPVPEPEPEPGPPLPAIAQFAVDNPWVGLARWPQEKRVIFPDAPGREFQAVLFERALVHWHKDEGVGLARIGAMWDEDTDITILD